MNQFDSAPLENAVLYVPAGSETKYQEAIGWMKFGRKETVVMSGNCCENESSDVTWNFDLPKRVLTVSGTEAIMNIDTTPPWHLFQFLITGLVIENGITSIGTSAFAGCESLTSVIIPQSVTEIEPGAFVGCTGLTSVTNLNPEPQILGPNGTQFNNVTLNSATLFIPAGSEANYREADIWPDFGERIVLATSIDLLESSVTKCLNETEQLTVAMPEDVTDKTVTWASNSPIATVSDSGLATAKAGGTAVITVTTSYGVTDSCTVHVESNDTTLASLAVNDYNAQTSLPLSPEFNSDSLNYTVNAAHITHYD
ncbi:MAG: leucine-rich repeat protein [Dysgonamonadaceae bacterium]|nr:leucine-rich repeat protein [Dysgonamonadaceae bacterium]